MDAMYEALESDSGEVTTARDSGGRKSNSSKVCSSELNKNDPSCDECCVVSWEFMGNVASTAVLGTSNTPFLGTRARAGTGHALRCGFMLGAVGRGAAVDAGTVGEGSSRMRDIRRGTAELIASSGDVK